jgi:hypothetical protein
MLSWILRPILAVAAVIAGWFVARDAANFSVIQMVVILLLIAGLVAAAAGWELLAEWFRQRKNLKP